MARQNKIKRPRFEGTISEAARLGGLAASKSMTAEQKKARAQKAANARWNKPAATSTEAAA